MSVVRLQPGDLALARDTFTMMNGVFAENGSAELGDRYLSDLLVQPRVWVYAAIADDRPVAGLVGHQLPMTRAETSELLIYDLAVRADYQRRGVGQALVQRVLDDAGAAGIAEVWVPADNEDVHALDFYRRTGGTAQAVTIFTYPTE